MPTPKVHVADVDDFAPGGPVRIIMPHEEPSTSVFLQGRGPWDTMSFCELLKEAIKDEEIAPRMYHTLIQKYDEELPVPGMPSPEEEYGEESRMEVPSADDVLVSSMLNSIISDEEKHKRTLDTLWNTYCVKGTFYPRIHD